MLVIELKTNIGKDDKYRVNAFEVYTSIVSNLHTNIHSNGILYLGRCYTFLINYLCGHECQLR